uniref:Claudin n=1 Tax=Strigops habroptila TaxID=2489341 RepID=A0A672U5G9_STRHB
MTAMLEIVGFLLCLGGLATIGATLPHNYWRVSSVYGSVITTVTLYENLWKSCAEDSTGVSNCKQFDSLLALPGITTRRHLLTHMTVPCLFGIIVQGFFCNTC